MTAPYSPGYSAYSSNELDELERQRQLLAGTAQPPAALDPMSGIGYDQANAAEPVAAPPPVPPPQPLDLTSAPIGPRKGMGVSSVTTQGLPESERSRLEKAHADLTGRRLGQIEQSADTERGINERGMGAANARGIEAANQEVYKRRELEESQRKQTELRKAQDEWSQKKEDPNQAFEGRDLALVLTGIGVAAGTFSQAMGWQNGNPVKESFDRTVDRSVAAQREQKNSRLNLLAARLGDEKAAELQIRGEMHDAIATRIQAQMQGTQHQDALDRLGPLAQDQALKAQEAQLAASESLAPKQSVTETPLQPKGPKSMTLSQQLAEQEAGQKIRQGKKSALLEAGVPPDQVDEMIDKAFPGLAPFRGQTTDQRSDAEKRAAADAIRKSDLENKEDNADQAKAAGAMAGAEAYGKEMGLARDPKTNEWRVGEDAKNPLWQGAKELVPFSSQKVSKMKAAAVEGFGRLESGGVIGKDELKTFQEMVTGATTAEQLAESLNSIETIIKPRLSKRTAAGATGLPSTIRPRGQ